MGELGERLRRAREAKGLTLDQLEEITRIRRRYLQALEEEDFGQLPGEVFVRGFLRNYAIALGLDPEDVLAISGHKAPPVVVTLDEREPLLDEPLTPEPATRWIVPALITVMIVAAVGLGVFILVKYNLLALPGAPARPTPSAATPAPALFEPTSTPMWVPTATPTIEPTRTPEPTATPVEGVLLRLEAAQQAWVLVTVDGRQAFEGTLQPGQAREWRGDDEITLRCGNAGGVRVWYNGQAQGPLGPEGQVVEQSWRAGPLPSMPRQTPVVEATSAPLGPPPASPTRVPTPTATRQG